MKSTLRNPTVITFPKEHKITGQDVHLTERDLEMIFLLATGYRYKEMAKPLSVSVQIVYNTSSELKKKTGYYHFGIISFAIHCGIVTFVNQKAIRGWKVSKDGRCYIDPDLWNSKLAGRNYPY